MEIENKKTRSKTSLHLRLSHENKAKIFEAKILGGFDTYEDMFMAFVEGEAVQKEKVNVDPDGHCIKALNELIKQSTNLNQLAKIANQQGTINKEKFTAFIGFNSKLIEIKKYLAENVIILKGRL